MRIISQSGMINLPYEQVGVSISTMMDTNMIIAYPASTKDKDSKFWTLAEYSTPEKAKKAMEMLREYYTAKFLIQVASDEARMATLEKLDVEEFAKQAVFQFPQDEEIEV